MIICSYTSIIDDNAWVLLFTHDLCNGTMCSRDGGIKVQVSITYSHEIMTMHFIGYYILCCTLLAHYSLIRAKATKLNNK